MIQMCLKFFGNVIPLDPQLFSKMNTYAAALLQGKTLAKYSPLEVAQWLEDMADISSSNLEEAEALVDDKSDVEFHRFYYDIKIQNGIGRFFAYKIRAAVLWHLYEYSSDMKALNKAIENYSLAPDFWVEMAEEAKDVYVDDISFGTAQKERGHWIDLIPAIDADIADMKEALTSASEKRVPAISSEKTGKAIQIIEPRPIRATVDCQHKQVEQFNPGDAINIEVTLTEGDV